MTVHQLPPKRPNLPAQHLARQQRLLGRQCDVEMIDPTDDPQWLAEQLPNMAKSITNAFSTIASEPTIERCELAAAQLHHIVVHLTWISAGLRKRGK